MEKYVSFFFSSTHSIITNKGDLNKENAKIKQALKENVLRKSLRKLLLTIAACVSHRNKCKP